MLNAATMIVCVENSFAANIARGRAGANERANPVDCGIEASEPGDACQSLPEPSVECPWRCVAMGMLFGPLEFSGLAFF
jgi:hypothetical protein